MKFLNFLSFWVVGMVLITGPCSESLAEEPASFKEEPANPQQSVPSPRLISITKHIEGSMLPLFRDKILTYDYEDSQSPIYIWINSPGGDISVALTLYDLMKIVKSPVITIGGGRVCSAASFLLSSGDKGERCMLPHSRLMIHRGQGHAFGPTMDMFYLTAEYTKKLRHEYESVEAENIGLPVEELKKISFGEYWMGAQEAINKGFVDRILSTSPFKADEINPPTEKKNQKRVISISGPLDDDKVNQTINALMNFAAMDPNEVIYVFINSLSASKKEGRSASKQEGSEAAAYLNTLLLYDIIKGIQAPIVTIAEGHVNFLECVLLSAGKKGNRFILPHTYVKFMQAPMYAGAATSEIFKSLSKEIKCQQKIILSLLSENTGQPVEKIKALFRPGATFLNAKEAVALGFVDQILTENPFTLFETPVTAPSP
jgi:ATP-dependent Clp protease protease subunit